MTRAPAARPSSPARALRPAGADDLGLRRALSDRLLPLLVAAMTFLAALALAGAFGAAALASHWQGGAAAVMTVQVPQPTGPAANGAGNRVDTVLAALRREAGVASARLVPERELTELLRPWLGDGLGAMALDLPAVIDVRLAGAPPPNLAEQLDAAAPGTLAERQEVWVRRLGALAHSLQVCAGLAVALVGFVAAAVVAVATRAGLASRRDAIEIVHGLGATRGYIANRFARRATMLATSGGALGAAAALPVLAGLSGLARPLTGQDGPASLADALPGGLWLTLPLLPVAAAGIGWLTAQGTVRRWLRRLP